MDSLYVGIDTTQAFPLATVRFMVLPWKKVPSIPWWKEVLWWASSHWMMLSIVAAVLLFIWIKVATRDEEVEAACEAETGL